jgi:metal-responsive CopG/Arc/MetJ family transcriptional regulator
MDSPMSEKVLITLRQDNLNVIDELVRHGAASSRSEMVDKIIGGFVSDLRAKRQSNSALGNLVGFLLLLLGIAAIAEIFGGEEK